MVARLHLTPAAIGTWSVDMADTWPDVVGLPRFCVVEHDFNSADLPDYFFCRTAYEEYLAGIHWPLPDKWSGVRNVPASDNRGVRVFVAGCLTVNMLEGRISVKCAHGRRTR